MIFVRPKVLCFHCGSFPLSMQDTLMSLVYVGIQSIMTSLQFHMDLVSSSIKVYNNYFQCFNNFDNIEPTPITLLHFRFFSRAYETNAKKVKRIDMCLFIKKPDLPRIHLLFFMRYSLY